MCSRPRLCERVSVGFLRNRIYISADSELKALWQVPRKRADLNFSDEAPSIDLNGTDTERDHEHRGEGNTILHVHRS